MSANATATLTIKARTVGVSEIRALAAEMGRMGVSAQRAGARGVRTLGQEMRAAGSASGGARGKFRTLEQEIARLQRKMDQERITRKAREMLNGPPGPPKIVGKLRTVEGEMRRLDLLQKNRAITATARERLGMSPSILTGHGFMSRSRQTIGLMRDLTVAGMGVRMAFAGAAAGVHTMVGPMMEFENTLARVKVKGGFTSAELAQVAQAAKTSGRSTFFGARENAAAAVELAASGLNAQEISAQLPTVMRFALSSELNTEQASSTLVETMAQFFGSGNADKFERIGNVLKQAADISTISVSDIAESFSYVGPIAKSAGIELEQMSAIMAILGERGIKASMAGTAMRRMITSMVKPVGQAKQALAALKLTPDELREGLQDLPGFFDKLRERLAGRSRGKRLAILSALFGERGIASANILLEAAGKLGSDGRDELQKYTDAVTNSSGAMKKAADIMGNTLEGKLKKLSAATEAAQIELGEKLAPMLTELIPKMSKAAISTADFVKNHGDLVETLAIAIPSIAGLTFAVNGLGTAFAGIGKVSALLGIESMGMGAGAAFGTSFIGAALPVIAAGIAGYGIGTLIAEAVDAEGIGKRLYDTLHPEEAKGYEGETYNASLKVKDAYKQKLAAEDRDRQARGLSALPEDPALRDIARNLPAGSNTDRAAGWNGTLQIEILENGKARVRDLRTEGPGPELDVGTSVP